jgi:hypothetical protein
MNDYTGLHFAHRYLADPRQATGYGASYGNRVANDRLLRERWDRLDRGTAHGREDDIDSAPKAA